MDLEKAFDRVLLKVIWWAMLRNQLWNLVTAQGMYENLRSCVPVGKGLSDKFEVKVSVHQGPVLSPLLFIILLDALSWERGRFQLTGSRSSLSAFPRKRVMRWTEATIED